MPLRLERLPGLRQAPALLTRTRKDVVLFDSWRGAYSDNPRAISDALAVLRPDLQQTWVAHGSAIGLLPRGARAVRFGSPGYLAALGRAGNVVTNIGMPGYYRKPRAARYLQTWHGTPLKRIAFDITSPEFPDRDGYLERLRRDVARWDALVSPNAFSTEVLRRAFRYEGRVLETGYPRNDILVSAEAGERRRAIRAELGLREDVQAVLYAPTWRDSKSFDLQLDLAALGRRLGHRIALLLRTHPLAPITLDEEQRAWATDVSEHPDIRDLYLACDVLVTDYSSSMFDFAVTGKPMLFFTFDLAEYRDEMRGFYFDFESEAPGPLLADTAALGDALEDLSAITARYASEYARFRERFCALEDGRASERVVEAMFAEQ